MIPGDIVLVNFPYTNLLGAKLRPAVILHTAAKNDFTVVFMTSNLEIHTNTSIVVLPTKENGLLSTTAIVTHKVANLNEINIYGLLGKLSTADFNSLKRKLIEVFQLSVG